jgi:hypothetical protein
MFRYRFIQAIACLIIGLTPALSIFAADSAEPPPAPVPSAPTTGLAPVPGASAPAVKAIPPGEASSLEAIQKQLADIQLSLQSLKAQDTEIRLRKLESEITGIREQLGRMEASLKSSKAESRTSFSISPPASPTTTGTIRLSNTSAYYASVNIGGLLYRVAPGQVLPIANQPVGDFKYDVQADGFGLIQPATQRSLGAGEVFTIFIYPR